MRKIVMLAAVYAAACTLPIAAFAAPALPSAPGETLAITLVAGGCGPAFHRRPDGACVPNEGPRVVVGPRGGAIVCPPGYHLGPHRKACWPN